MPGTRPNPASSSATDGSLPSSALVGRDDELAYLADVVRDIHHHGDAVLVRGDPGIGKSKLLRRAAALSVAAGCTVLTATGIEKGDAQPFTGLRRILDRLLLRDNHLPAVQQRALLTAFGLADGPPAELFVVALAALNLLTGLAESRPVVLLVDDMHWLDSATIDVLAFIARRVQQDPIVIIGAVRAAGQISFSAA